MSGKKWVKRLLISILIPSLVFGVLIIVADPYLHYHAPLNFLTYAAGRADERYINYGILKHFDYDAIITGTSHNENFKASEFDKLFGVKSVKAPLAGAQLKEIAEQTEAALRYNDNLKCVLYGINYEDILSDKDSYKYEDLPTYLYDDNILNDGRYVFSGASLKKVLRNFVSQLRGEKSFDFDGYANFNDSYTFSKEAVLEKYEREKDKKAAESLSGEEVERLRENISQNVEDVVKQKENVTFYLFLTPHSIVWWDSVSQSGDILKYLEAEEILARTLLKYDNVKLYSFFNNYDLTCNLDNYTDKTHYNEGINSKILKWIKDDEYLLTEENLDGYLEKERAFYLNYDYDKIFEN